MLSNVIIQRINKEGPISFRDFMEMALYYPGLGYYTSFKETIGEKGDYYTSSTLSGIFGALITKQLEEMYNSIGEDNFTIIEYGAGTGALCHDILNALKSNSRLYNRLTYYIIEKSNVMRQTQAKHLSEKVEWVNSIKDIAGISGCVLSNEMLDNFAVHQVVMQDELMEVFVGYNNGFIEILQPATQALTNYLKELNVVLPNGFRTEINLEATQWIRDIAISLNKGYLLTIDYGYFSQELYSDLRRDGTLVCYNKHKVNYNPYLDIGLQDITSHVNFSALCHWGEQNGLKLSGFTNQGHFLLALGFKEYLRSNAETLFGNNIKDELFLTQTLLIDMGNKFKVLLQQKNVPHKMLTGLALSNPVRM